MKTALANTEKEDVVLKPLSSATAGGGVDRKVIEQVEVMVEAYLGGARMTVGELSALGTDGVVTLDASLASPVELRLNGAVIGRGELVAVGDRFGVRLVEIGG